MARWTVRIPDELARQVEERLRENCQRRDLVLRHLLERYVEQEPWALETSSEKPAAPAPARPPIRTTRPARRPPPSKAQLREARRLAAAAGIEIPDDALAFRSACADFIAKMKKREGASAPS